MKNIDKEKALNNKKAIVEQKAKKTIDDYKKFAIKGNVMDLAIGVTIGTAFTNIVNAIVTNFITPMISLITNKVDLSTLFIALDGKKYTSITEAKEAGSIIISYGTILNAVLNFFFVSIILFILFKYLSKLRSKEEKGEAETAEATTKTCKYCMSKIDIKATRCAFCTSEVELEKTEPISKKKSIKKVTKIKKSIDN